MIILSEINTTVELKRAVCTRKSLPKTGTNQLLLTELKVTFSSQGIKTIYMYP